MALVTHAGSKANLSVNWSAEFYSIFSTSARSMKPISRGSSVSGCSFRLSCSKFLRLNVYSKSRLINSSRTGVFFHIPSDCFLIAVWRCCRCSTWYSHASGLYSRAISCGCERLILCAIDTVTIPIKHARSLSSDSTSEEQFLREQRLLSRQGSRFKFWTIRASYPCNLFTSVYGSRNSWEVKIGKFVGI